jgi:sugar (pentulose or hexulose) kinase
MAVSLIAFSAQGGDYILVEGEPTEVNEQLAVSRRSTSGLCQLTQVADPSGGQRFEPAPVFVNPDRVAYVRPPAGRQAVA